MNTDYAEAILSLQRFKKDEEERFTNNSDKNKRIQDNINRADKILKELLKVKQS